jgi:flagellar hook-associated protein 3 FlgL
MRVTHSMLGQGLMNNLNTAMQALGDIQKRADSGKQILKPSDAPGDAALALRLRRMLRKSAQYQDNITNVRSLLTETETAISDMNEIMKSALDIAVRGGNDVMGDEELAQLAVTIDNLKGELVSMGNTVVAGRYIFGGYNGDTPPFEVIGTDLYYNGQPLSTGVFTTDEQEIQYIDLGRGLTMTPTGPVPDTAFAVSIPGCTVMGQGADNLYGMLQELSDALKVGDTNAVRNLIPRLQDGQTHLLHNMVITGERQSVLDKEMNRLETLDITRTDQLSQIEDMDLAEASIELAQRQMAYDTALAIGAKMILPSLADYLK